MYHIFWRGRSLCLKVKLFLFSHNTSSICRKVSLMLEKWVWAGKRSLKLAKLPTTIYFQSHAWIFDFNIWDDATIAKTDILKVLKSKTCSVCWLWHYSSVIQKPWVNMNHLNTKICNCTFKKGYYCNNISYHFSRFSYNLTCICSFHM